MRRILLALAVLTFSKLSYCDDIYHYVDKRCNDKCENVGYILLAIKYFSLINNIPINWLTALVSVESRFDYKARNGRSLGLTQVDVFIHRTKFIYSPLDVIENLRVGSIILKDCMNRKKNDPKKSFECYNGGGDPNYYIKISKEINKLNTVSNSHFI